MAKHKPLKFHHQIKIAPANNRWGFKYFLWILFPNGRRFAAGFEAFPEPDDIVFNLEKAMRHIKSGIHA